MKKLFIFVAALAVSSIVYAKDDKLVLEQGSLDFWSETGKFAIIEIDWSKTQVVEWDGKKVQKEFGTIDQYNRMKGEDYVNDWPKVQEGIKVGAPIEANKVNKKKGLKIITPLDPATQEAFNQMTDQQKAEWQKTQAKAEKNGVIYKEASEATYEIKLIVDSIDMGNAAASFFTPDPHNGGAIIVGNMSVYNRETKELVASIKINHLKGIGTASETARMQMIFYALWKEAFPKFVKEQAKK